MDLVEHWMLLKNQYEEHLYNARRLTQIQRQFPHGTSNINETEITTKIQSAYLGRKAEKNQSETLSIKYCTNLINSIEETDKVPAATHLHHMQRR